MLQPTYLVRIPRTHAVVLVGLSLCCLIWENRQHLFLIGERGWKEDTNLAFLNGPLFYDLLDDCFVVVCAELVLQGGF